MLDPLPLRSETLRRVEQAGFPSPPVHFPVLWEAGNVPTVRDVQQLIERAAVLNVIVNCSYGMPTNAASEWLTDSGLADCLTHREHRVVAGALGRVDVDKTQIEAINALAWVLGLVGALDVAALCGDDLAAKLPDLRRSEPIGEWLERSSVCRRADEEVIAEWDLHFCLTWGLAEANLRGDSAPGALPQYVYWQRRRAFEFVCATDTQHGDWDDIDLST